MFGFFAMNNNGQVLISSDTRNLHFVGKAVLTSVPDSASGYGGFQRGIYTIQCAVTPVPFFTMPTNEFYAIAAVRNVGGYTWEIELIRSGNYGEVPEVYVFSDPRGATQRANSDYGMLVMTADGGVAFDSRMSPLVITGGLAVQPPSNPITTAVSGLSAQGCRSMVTAGQKMAPNNYNSYGLSTYKPITKPIFYYPSIAQSQRQYNFSQSERRCTGFSVFGNCIGYESKAKWESRYWAFFRGGIRYTAGQIQCGWIAVKYGCNYSSNGGSSFLGISLGGSGSTGGTWPYSNKTLNIVDTAVIIADGYKYD